MSKAAILIVEDEAVTAMDLKQILQGMGYSVCGISSTGEMAIELARTLHPDLVLMDIQLAGTMNGIEAAENIRNNYHIPVAYLTALSDDKVLDRARITEPFGYIVKPVREPELKATIEMALYKAAMEHKLRVSEETTRVLLNETGDLHYLMDTDGKFLAVNEALAKKAGKSPAQLVGSRVLDMVASGHLSSRMACWSQAPFQKQSLQFEEEFGQSWFDIGIHPICNPKGDVIRYAVHIHDITRTKRIEEQLLQNEDFFRYLIGNSSDVIIILNRDGTFHQESPSFNRVTGNREGQTAGRNFLDMIQKDNDDTVRRTFAEILNTPYMIKTIRMVIRSKTGTRIFLDGMISNLCDNPIIEGVVLNGWIVESPPDS